MAKNVTVTATFAGDSTGLEKAFQRVGGAAEQMGKDMDKSGGSVERFAHGMEGAETAGDRAERGVRGLTDILGVAAEQFGLPLGPALAFGGALTQLGGGVADLAPELARLPGLQGAVAGAQRALNLVMAGNPIALVVLAIAALVGAFITAYSTSETFRDIVNGVFGAVLGVAQTVFGTILSVIQGPFNWARDNWQLLLAILTGPIGLAVLAITGHFDDMVDFITKLPGRVSTAVTGLFDKATGLATDAKDWITGKLDDVVDAVSGLPRRVSSAAGGLFDGVTGLATDAKNWVTGKLDDMVGWVRGMPSKITSAASGLFDGLIGAAKSGLNTVIDAINGFIGAVNSIHISAHIPGWVPGVGGKGFDLSFSIPSIPHLAQGGIISAPTLALIGEAGPEAVVPLSRGGLGNTYHITVNSLDPRTAAKTVIDAIDQYERRNGPRFARA